MSTLSFCAQILAAQSQNHQGTDFWFAFLQNANDMIGSASYKVLVVTKEEARVSLESSRSGLLVSNQVIPANSSVTLTIPNASAQIFSTATVDNRTLHLTSNVPVVAYALLIGPRRVETSLILPTPLLGNQYQVLSTPTYNTGTLSVGIAKSELNVIATSNNTRIRVTPACNMEGGINRGVDQNFTLDRGEIIQLKARNVNNDVSGTFIRSTNGRNFAVFSGHQFTRINTASGLAPLYSVGLANEHLGTEYIYLPSQQTLPDGIDNDMVRILATTDNTTVNITIQGVTNTTVLNRGDFLEQVFNDIAFISSDNPIVVGEFLPSTNAGLTGGNDSCNPSFMLLHPNKHMFMTEAFFTAPDAPLSVDAINNFERFTLDVIIRTKDQNDILLNGNPLTGFTPLPDNPEYAYLQHPVSADLHYELTTTRTACGFLAYLKGFGQSVSYAHSIGMAYQDPTSEKYTRSNLSSGANDLFCFGDDVKLSVSEFSHLPDSIHFSFNGEKVQSGDFSDSTYVHSVDEYGVFPISIVLDYSCHPNDTLIDTLYVNELVLGNLSDTSICHGEKVSFTALPNDTLQHQWYYIDKNQQEHVLGTSDTCHNRLEGEYRVEITDLCQVVKADSFYVTIHPVPFQNEIDDRLECSATLVDFEANSHQTFGSVNFDWQYWDGSDWNPIIPPATLVNDSVLQTDLPGRYRVILTDACVLPDTSEFELSYRPVLSLSPIDTFTICNDSLLSIAANTLTPASEVNYEWEKNQSSGWQSLSSGTDSLLSTMDTGNFRVTVSDMCTQIQDTFRIQHYPELSFSPLVNDTICNYDTLLIHTPVDTHAGYLFYIWYQYEGDQKSVVPNELWLSADSILIPDSGRYQLVISDQCVTDSSSFSVSYYDEFTLLHSSDTTVCSGSSVENWVSHSDNLLPHQFNWENADGINVCQDSIFNTNDSGIYKIIVSDQCYADSAEIKLSFFESYALPSPEVSYQICEGDTILVEDAQVVDPPPYAVWYNWSHLNGNDNPSIVSLYEARQYDLSISDEYNCQQADYTIELLFFEDIPIPSLPDSIEKCPATNELFDIHLNQPLVGQLNYRWYASSNPEIILSTDSSLLGISNQVGNRYVIEVFDDNQCAFRRDTSVVHLIEDFSVSMLTSEEEICESKEYREITHVTNPALNPGYETRWYKDGAVLAAGQNTLTIHLSGVYELEISDAKNCFVHRDTVQIDSLPNFSLPALPSETVCQETQQSYSFEVASHQREYQYEWTGPDGTPQKGETIDAYEEGVYHYSADDGCFKNENSFSYSWAPILKFDGIYPEKMCDQGTELLVITQDANVSLQWVNQTELNTIEFELTESGEYDLRIEDEFQCFVDTTIFVDYYEKPTLDDWEGVMCDDEFPVILMAQNTNDYICKLTWEDGTEGPNLKVRDPGQYTLTASHAHCDSYDTGYQLDRVYDIQEKSCSYSIFIPNAFTPVSESLSEEVQQFGPVLQWDIIEHCDMRIFDRWGKLLFERQLNGNEDFWNGNFLGEECQPDTYVYVINVTYFDERSEETRTKAPYIGTVTLIR